MISLASIVFRAYCQNPSNCPFLSLI